MDHFGVFLVCLRAEKQGVVGCCKNVTAGGCCLVFFLNCAKLRVVPVSGPLLFSNWLPMS